MNMESKQINIPPHNRRKSRWSAVDTLIVLLVLAAIAGIIYRVVITVTAEPEAGEVYEVYFEVQETHRDVIAEVRPFDAVYLVENDMRLGAIAATIAEGAGTPAASLIPSYIEGTDMATATGCMTCRAVLSGNGSILVEGTGRYLTSGSILEIRTDRVLMTVRITDIREKS